jgi:hypothetical protein
VEAPTRNYHGLGGHPCPSRASSQQNLTQLILMQWKSTGSGKREREYPARWQLTCSIRDVTLQKIAKKPSVHEMWTAITKEFESKTSLVQADLRTKFYTLRRATCELTLTSSRLSMLTCPLSVSRWTMLSHHEVVTKKR